MAFGYYSRLCSEQFRINVLFENGCMLEMETVIWIAVAIIVYLAKNRIKNIKEKEMLKTAKWYICISLLLAVFGQIGIIMIFHVNHISKWLLLTYILIALQFSYMLESILSVPEKWKLLLCMLGKIIVGMCILSFYYFNLSHHMIGVSNIAGRLSPISAGRADLAIILATTIWIYGSNILKKFSKITHAIYWIILSWTPFLVFLIVEFSWNPAATEISLFNMLLNILIYLSLELFFINLLRKKMLGLQLLYVLAWLTGGLNYYLLKLRGQPFLATDIFALRTAASVVDQYKLQISEELALTFLVLIFLLSCIWALGMSGLFDESFIKWRKFFKTSGPICLALVFAFLLGRYDLSDKYHVDLDFWNQKNTYQRYGFAPSFISFWQKTKISKPDGYSEQKVETLLEDIGVQPTEQGNSEEKERPTIITIMNESFSDLTALGPFDCAENDLKFLHSLKDDPHTIEYGWNYVSTRGGGTSTTEFEYLTGNLMAHINGINPYSNFDFTGVPSMVSLLKEEGYHTIAMHPEAAVNWRRSTVYPKLGFDEFLSIDSFKDSERTVWNRVSDLGDYQKLIEVYEAQTAPSFIFNVTMQNHGGYNGLSELNSDEVVEIDENYQEYTDVQMYESLIAKSDRALEYLISYFEQVDKPVIICFFGDHQPSLNSIFEDSMKSAGKKLTDTDLTIAEKMYAVPYFIWSNYDISDDYSKKNAEGEQVISTNYLGALVRKYAGLELSAYDYFRLEQREQLPVFNFVGYMTNQGQWYDYSIENPFSDWVERSQDVQYYALFDKKRSMRYFSKK